MSSLVAGWRFLAALSPFVVLFFLVGLFGRSFISLCSVSGGLLVVACPGAARGEVLFSAGVAGRVLEFFRVDADAARRARPFPELTDREYEILTCVADGSSNDQVGRRLGLSAKTVANNLSRVFTKLQVTDRAQAIVKAHRAGIANQPEPR